MLQPAEHARSYYAATARGMVDHPTLTGAETADVVVVGGGFTGVSCALELAERGFRVALLEANRIGWGASGRNGGQLIDGFVETDKIRKRLGEHAARIAAQMGLECRDIVVQRIERHGIECDLKFGYLDVAMKSRELRDLCDDVAKKRADGYPHQIEIIPRERLHEVIGSDRYVGGVMNQGNGHLHPLNLCLGEARVAAEAGVRFFERSPVRRIEPGAEVVVHTARGSVSADFLVVACNAYLGGLIPRLSGTVIPAGSYVIATEPLSGELAREILPKDSAVCDQRVALDYYRLSADRRLLFGGLCNYSGRAPGSIRGTLEPNMLKVFPQLAGTSIDYEWGGQIGISINRIPQLNRLGNNIYYAHGFSGHGLAPTHMAGRVLAEAIAGQAERFDVFARIRHWRLPGGRWFANPALAVGMLYHRLREIL
ncbi:MAG: FAD-binding oxidoreductase [Gammaproteobacteria bacterium]